MAVVALVISLVVFWNQSPGSSLRYAPHMSPDVLDIILYDSWWYPQEAASTAQTIVELMPMCRVWSASVDQTLGATVMRSCDRRSTEAQIRHGGATVVAMMSSLCHPLSGFLQFGELDSQVCSEDRLLSHAVRRAKWYEKDLRESDATYLPVGGVDPRIIVGRPEAVFHVWKCSPYCCDPDAHLSSVQSAISAQGLTVRKPWRPLCVECGEPRPCVLSRKSASLYASVTAVSRNMAKMLK